jgi:phosphoribosylglycinamide formyltransferase-1
MRVKAGRNIGVLISGRGSNLEAILKARAAGSLGAEIRVVISNEQGAGGLQHAAEYDVPAYVLSHRGFARREEYEEQLIRELRAHEVEVVVLAGFMRLLTDHFLAAFPNRVINIHPSILPAFPGVDAQGQAMDYGVRVSGCTVHFVDGGTDSGPIIDQAVVPVLPGDDRDRLAERILEQEHRVFPRALSWLIAGRVEIRGREVVVHAQDDV